MAATIVVGGALLYEALSAEPAERARDLRGRDVQQLCQLARPARLLTDQGQHALVY